MTYVCDKETASEAEHIGIIIDWLTDRITEMEARIDVQLDADTQKIRHYIIWTLELYRKRMNRELLALTAPDEELEG